LLLKKRFIHKFIPLSRDFLLKKYFNMKKLLWMLVSIIMLGACSTVPIIGRKQMNLLPESQLVSMGLTNYKSFLDTVPVVKAGDPLQMVKKSGTKISNAVEKFLKENGFEDRLKDFSWEFNLVNDATINAWCMPGGKVVFYSGILPLCENESGVAVVMGHEIAHAVARHGNERMSQGLVAQLGGMALDVAMKEQPEQTRNIFLSAYGVGAQIGLVLPYSRKHEYEADKLGLIFMTMAGYNPQEAVKFWQRMSAAGGAKVPEFLSTHPMDTKRIEALQKLLPEMEKYKPKS
jgi:predicted Zn-dependent protease